MYMYLCDLQTSAALIILCGFYMMVDFNQRILINVFKVLSNNETKGGVGQKSSFLNDMQHFELILVYLGMHIIERA